MFLCFTSYDCPGSLPPIPLTRESVPGYVYIRRSVALKSNYEKYSDIYHIHRVPVISTTVLLCTIVLPVVFFSFSALIDSALITQEPIELETSRFHQKICLITPSNLFWSSIIVWVPNSQQTLKQKPPSHLSHLVRRGPGWVAVLQGTKFYLRRHYLPLVITFVCMLFRGNC